MNLIPLSPAVAFADVLQQIRGLQVGDRQCRAACGRCLRQQFGRVCAPVFPCGGNDKIKMPGDRPLLEPGYPLPYEIRQKRKQQQIGGQPANGIQADPAAIVIFYEEIPETAEDIHRTSIRLTSAPAGMKSGRI